MQIYEKLQEEYPRTVESTLFFYGGGEEWWMVGM